jgi:branched-chain amino acid transport system substrate-binding protein
VKRITIIVMILVMILLVFLLLASAFVFLNAGQVPETAEKEIKIGWIGPLSGDGAIIGSENLRGVQMAIDDLNSMGGIRGKKIRLIIEDDKMQAESTVNAFEKLTEFDNVKNVIVTAYSGVLALQSRAEQKNIVVMSSLDTSKELADAGDNIFAVGVYDEGIGYALADFATKKLHVEKAAIIYYNGEAFTHLTKDSITKKLEQNGAKVVLTQEYAAGERDFRAQLLKIPEDADAVFVVGYEEAGFILKQAKEMKINKPMLAIDTTLSEGFQKNAGDALEGLYFTSWIANTSHAKKVLDEIYVNKYSSKPEQPLFVATGYDATTVLANAIKNSDETPDSVKSNLYMTRDFQGITGNLTMSPDGIVRTIEESMFRIENGTAVPVE